MRDKGDQRALATGFAGTSSSSRRHARYCGTHTGKSPSPPVHCSSQRPRIGARAARALQQRPTARELVAAGRTAAYEAFLLGLGHFVDVSTHGFGFPISHCVTAQSLTATPACQPCFQPRLRSCYLCRTASSNARVTAARRRSGFLGGIDSKGSHGAHLLYFANHAHEVRTHSCRELVRCQLNFGCLRRVGMGLIAHSTRNTHITRAVQPHN